jgi:hypothetical protein
VEGLDDAAGTLAFGDHENDRRDGAAVRDMPLTFFPLLARLPGVKFRAFALAGDPPSWSSVVGRSTARREVGRLRRRNRIFSLVVVGWLLPAGPPFSCPNANASSLVIIFFPGKA